LTSAQQNTNLSLTSAQRNNLLDTSSAKQATFHQLSKTSYFSSAQQNNLLYISSAEHKLDISPAKHLLDISASYEAAWFSRNEHDALHIWVAGDLVKDLLELSHCALVQHIHLSTFTSTFST